MGLTKSIEVTAVSQTCLADSYPKIGRKILLLAVASLIFGASCWAQGTRNLNLFGGFSFANYAPIPLDGGPISSAPPAVTASTGIAGWNASLEFKPIRIVSILADFSGFYGDANRVGCTDLLGPGNCGVSTTPVLLHTFLVGPQLSFSVGRLRPFGHALIGAAHVRVGGSFPGNSDTSFAGALGGGIDYWLVPRLALRVQADALETTFSDSFRSARAGQVNLRVSAGLVIHF
jgi:hypothetical protein